MGTRGPIPNREGDLARPRSRQGSNQDQTPVTKGMAHPVYWPDPDPDWHPIAEMFWDAAQTSGQAAYYQQTDIALLYSWCEDISKYKGSARRSGQMLATLYSAASSLLLTEADRRRMRIELEEPAADTEDEGVVVAMAAYKDALG